MIIQGKQNLAKYLNVSYSSVDTNFPKLAATQLAQGIQIIREGKGENTIYHIEQVEPQKIDKASFSRKQKAIDLEGEIWKIIPDFPNHQISNLGRIKNKYGYLIKGSPGGSGGYLQVELKQGNKQSLHRLVMQTFCPVDNPDLFTVDHINGIRTDNRLENLRWCSIEDNVSFMIIQRSDLNKELTRIIQKYGYDKTLKLLQAM